MKIAFIGLGEMGRRMCLRLIQAGHTVSVYNRNVEKAQPLAAHGAQVAHSVLEACQSAEIAISMLRDDEASNSVWSVENLRELAGSQLAIIDMSTLSKDGVTELSRKVNSAGLRFVAAPVIGSLVPAETGKLVILAGGDPSMEGVLAPVFASIGEKTHWFDSPEATATLKLAVNFYFSVQVKGVFDALAVVTKIDSVLGAQAFELFKSLPIVSAPIAGILGLVQSKNFKPSFPIQLVEKDLGYFSELTAHPSTVRAVQSSFVAAIEAGLGEENIHAIWKLM